MTDRDSRGKIKSHNETENGRGERWNGTESLHGRRMRKEGKFSRRTPYPLSTLPSIFIVIRHDIIKYNYKKLLILNL